MNAQETIRDMDAISMAMGARLTMLHAATIKGHDYLLRDAVMREVAEWRRMWDKNSAARTHLERVALSDAEIRAVWDGMHWSTATATQFARAILAAQASMPRKTGNPVMAEQAITQPVIAEATRDDRARGRAEALAIVLTLDAETGLDDYLVWGDSGCSGESSASWNEEKLRELLHVDSELADMMDKAEDEYWHNLGLREEAERNAVKRDDAAGDAKRISLIDWSNDLIARLSAQAIDSDIENIASEALCLLESFKTYCAAISASKEPHPPSRHCMCADCAPSFPTDCLGNPAMLTIAQSSMAESVCCNGDDNACAGGCLIERSALNSLVAAAQASDPDITVAQELK